MPELADSYRGKKVLVTGHTGFKGGWLSIWLHRMGAEVLGYSLPMEGERTLYKSANVGSIVTSEMGDICGYDHLFDFIKRERPEFVFHMAAQPLVRKSFREPVRTFEVNVMGTVNLLEAVHQVDSVRSCVMITSDKCYENREWVHPYRETDPMGGYDPYSASKGAAELVVSSFRRSFFAGEKPRCGIASARAGNVIGGGDWAEDRLIPDCIRSLAKGEDVLVRNPSSVRPWQHVLEPLHGYLMLGARLRNDPVTFAEGWNFGPSGEAWNVGHVVEEMVKVWGKGRWKDVSQPGQPHEAHYLRLDSTKARSILGWAPRLTTAQAIAMTASWYRRDMGGEDMRQFTENQIDAYEKAFRPQEG